MKPIILTPANQTLFFILAVFFFNLACNMKAKLPPTSEQCATMPHLQFSLAKSAKVASAFQENQELVTRAQAEALALTGDTIIIPVIVHVVWNMAAQNVSDAQILSQINVLNEDYRRMIGTNGYNNNPIGADAKIEFRLAQIDLLGKPCNGIERINTQTKAFYHDDKVKFAKSGGADAWDSKRYLNIWVCNLSSTTPGRDLLGYATFPGEPANVDGVVINYRYFGDNVGTSVTPPNNLGRTATHEVGHWLNLFHTFQGDTCLNSNCLEQGDKVCDTPPVDSPTNGCPNNRVSCGVTTLVSDYMDYSSDNCMNILTQGQNYRARTTMDFIRNSLKTSNALTSTNLTLFGEHKGGYNYVLDYNIVVNGSGVYSPFSIPSGSNVSIEARGKKTVSFGYNVKVESGGTLVVRQSP